MNGAGRKQVLFFSLNLSLSLLHYNPFCSLVHSAMLDENPDRFKDFGIFKSSWLSPEMSLFAELKHLGIKMAQIKYFKN